MKNKEFGDIFKTNTAEKMPKSKGLDEISAAYSKISDIDSNLCDNWKYADRNNFELGDLESLARDIKENGQIQPIIVRKKSDGRYEVIAGERRWRACKLLKIAVKAIISDKDDLNAFIMQSSENSKKDLSPYSRSISYGKILEEKVTTQNKLAEKLGISKSSFSELLSFSMIPHTLWDAVGDMTKVSISTASYIRKVINEDKRNIEKLILFADKIRSGVGKKSINQYLSSKDEVKKRIIKDGNGSVILTVSKDKIIFSESSLNKINIDDIITHIMKSFNN